VSGYDASRSRLHSRLHQARRTQATEWQRVGNQIDTAMIFARADFVNVLDCHESVMKPCFLDIV
jgi:hypothetical protein